MAVLAQADLLALTSRSEPFGMVALEAAALGVPAVVPKHAGAAEVLPDAAGFDEDDAEGLADIMVRILTDPQRRRTMCRKNLEAARRRTWPKAAAEIVKLYREVVNLQPRTGS